jgi:hypothetical protein
VPLGFNPQQVLAMTLRLLRSSSQPVQQVQFAETRSSSKDYADAEDDAVNKRACKSMERKELAPQIGLELAFDWLTAVQFARVFRREKLFEGNPLAFPVRLSRDFPKLEFRNKAGIRWRQKQNVFLNCGR